MPIAALSALLALAGPFALQVNARRWSPDEVAAAVAETGSEDAAVRVLTARALLLQEAQAFGFSSSATTPAAQANAFLEHLYPASVVCAQVGDRELNAAFQAMRRRFKHPPLATVAELAWDCGAAGPDETLPCTRAAHTLATSSWVPLVADVHHLEDLAWLAASAPAAPLELRDSTWAVPALLRRLAEERSEPALPTALSVGDAWVQLTPGGARLLLVVETEPAADADINTPGVREELTRYACERRVAETRGQYVEGLMGSTRPKRIPVAPAP